MNAKLWVTLNQQMHMIGLNIQALYLRLMFLAYLANDLL